MADQNEWEKLRKDRDRLLAALDYFASCHAATLEYDGRLARTSKSSLVRFVSIGEAMLNVLNGGAVGATGCNYGAQRLRQAIKESTR